jgi:hypothetical protein
MIKSLERGQSKHQDDEQKHRHEDECAQVFVIKLEVHENV